MKVLHIDSSIQGAGSASRHLTAEIVARLRAAEGLAYSPQHREAAITAARASIPVPAALAA